MIRHVTMLVLAFGALACAPAENSELGTLSLALDSHAGGKDYRLIDARFALAGPENKTFLAEDDGAVTVELSPGNYTLSLLDDWTLTRLDDAGGPDPVKAHLVSENPIPLVITAGQTTVATLRFELEQGEHVPLGDGALEVELEVLEHGEKSAGDCADGLRINELDYDQAGSDDAEFVEVLNPLTCDAVLNDVALELVNGGDGKVYARYALAEGAEKLVAGARFLLGDPTLLAGISVGAKLALRGSGLQNGPDAVRLVRATKVLDAVAYGGPVSTAGEGVPAGKDDGEEALARCPDGTDSEQNASDFALAPPTPGAPNQCS
jgi:hypothetical protein